MPAGHTLTYFFDYQPSTQTYQNTTPVYTFRTSGAGRWRGRATEPVLAVTVGAAECRDMGGRKTSPDQGGYLPRTVVLW